MANISHTGTFYPFGTDLKKLWFIKTRVIHTCNICNNKIPSESYSFGSGWSRICFNCSYKFLNNFIKSVEEFKQIGVNLLKDIKKNRKKYEQVNTMAKI